MVTRARKSSEGSEKKKNGLPLGHFALSSPAELKEMTSIDVRAGLGLEG